MNRRTTLILMPMAPLILAALLATAVPKIGLAQSNSLDERDRLLVDPLKNAELEVEGGGDVVVNVTPGVRLFVHEYDFAIPDGRCVFLPSPHLRADF